MKNWFVEILAMHLLACGAWAETVEMVTYYPAPGGEDVNPDRLHTVRATVGDPYSLANPTDADLPPGTLLVAGSAGIGPDFGGAPPTQALEVEGNTLLNSPATALFMADRGAATNYSGLQLLTAGAVKWTIGSRNDSTENLHVYSDANDATRLFVEQGTGNVGIGTTTPAGRLQVQGVDDALSQILFVPGANTANPGAPEMRVGIGTTAPVGPLQVAGAADALSNVAFTPGPDTAAAGTPEIRVGIGTPAPQTSLDVAGDARIRGGLKPDYDSGWVADNNTTDHYTTFNHNLGDFPSRIEVWFAASNNPTVVYPINWSWRWDYSGNPVTISLTTTQVRFSIHYGSYLHGVWVPDQSQGYYGWTLYSNGYWRVKCWR